MVEMTTCLLYKTNLMGDSILDTIRLLEVREVVDRLYKHEMVE